MERDNTARLALRWSAAAAAILVAAGWLGSGLPAAIGMAIGSGLGLFSLWSLSFAVPRLALPYRPDRRLLFGFAWLARLCVIATVLWWAMSSRYVDPVAVFLGAGLVPIVIVGLLLKNALALSAEDWRPRSRFRRPPPTA
jgi:hypothetical protein